MSTDRRRTGGSCNSSRLAAGLIGVAQNARRGSGPVQQVAVLGDEELLVAARAGDQISFERLIEAHIAVGYRLAAAMLNDAGLAEDVVQEATLRAWRSIRQVRSSAQIRAWFLAIVANRSRTLRSARWWSVIRLPEPFWRSPSPAEAVENREDLSKALGRLSPDERAAVLLRFYEDLSSREIGLALGITASAARSRIRRALSRMRIDLAEEQL